VDREELVREIVRKMHEYRIRVPLGDTPAEDVEAVKQAARGFRTRSGSLLLGREADIEGFLREMWRGMATVVTGPRGCGKTSFFEAVTWAAARADTGYRFVLIHDHSPAFRSAHIVAPKELYPAVAAAVKAIKGVVVRREVERPEGLVRLELAAPSWGREGLGLVLAAWVRDEIVKGTIKGRLDGASDYVVVVDSHRARDAKGLRFDLEDASKGTYNDNQELMWAGVEDEIWVSEVVVVQEPNLVPEATGPLRDLLGELLLWNLPRGAADQYAEHLGLVERASRELGVGAEAAREVLWRLAGGNPDALEAMAWKGVEEWLERVALSLKDVLASYLLKKARGTLERAAVEEFAEELGRPERDMGAAPVESPDGFGFGPLATYLLDTNMLVYTFTLSPTSQLPREPWVGKWYAYSLPAYHYAIRAVHRKKSLEIGPKDILEEAMRG